MLCKPGSYYVKKHIRVSKRGKRHVVEAHCRKNPKSKKDLLFSSNLNYLFKNRLKKYSKLKRIKGQNDRGQYDEVIQFWLDFWKKKKEISFDIDPMIIKSIITVESSFRERVVTKIVGSSATGLMQVTKTSLGWLAGKPKKDGYVQIKKNQIDISQDEAKMANPNIAVGTRWLIHKINKSPYRKSKTNKKRLYGGIKYYYGWNNEGQEYLEKVLKVYEKNK